MKVLLDTSAFYWLLTSSSSVPERVRRLLARVSTQILVSVATAWEIAIKTKLGKLPLPAPYKEFLRAGIDDAKAEWLPIEIDHLARTLDLPPVHRDPFDRVLVAQALAEGAVVATSDPLFASYGVPVIW